MQQTFNRWLTKNKVTQATNLDSATSPDNYRWQSRKLVTAVTRTGTYIVVPAFNVAAGSDNGHDILAVYNYYSPLNFSILNVDSLSITGYSLTVAYANSDNSVVRYLLSGDVLPYFDVTEYVAQRIKKYFRIEIWGDLKAGATQVSDITLVTSVKSVDTDTAMGTNSALCSGSYNANMQSTGLTLPLGFPAEAQMALNS